MLIYEAFECETCGDIVDSLVPYGIQSFCEECQSIDSFHPVMLDENGRAVDIIELDDSDLNTPDGPDDPEFTLTKKDHRDLEHVADVLDYMQQRKQG